MNNSDRLKQKYARVNQPKSSPDRALNVKWSCRWDIFRRLKALDINCTCSTNKPLLIDLYSPTTAILIWSVLKQNNGDRQELVDWLDNCWEM